MSASAQAAKAEQEEPIAATCMRLRWLGFTEAEAANLGGLSRGIGMTTRPWTVHQLREILFLRELCRMRRDRSDPGDAPDESDRWLLSSLPNPVVATPDSGTPIPTTSPRGDGDHLADRGTTLLSLWRSLAGPAATLNFLFASNPEPGQPPDSARNAEEKGGWCD